MVIVAAVIETAAFLFLEESGTLTNCRHGSVLKHFEAICK